MKRSIIKYFILLFVLSLAACKVELPDNIIKPDKMEALLYDYHLAQAMSSDADGEYKRKLYAEYVFDKHGVTKAEFDSSMVWYMRYPNHLYKMYGSLYDKMVAEVDELSGEGGGKESTTAALQNYLTGDTVNLWQGINVELLSATPLRNNTRFMFDTDTTYKVGDSIIFSLDALFVKPHARAGVAQSAYAAMVLEYADSTFTSTSQRIEASGHYTLSVERNFDSTISAIFGYIYYTDNDSLAESKMLAGEISLVRIHAGEDDLDIE